MTLVSDLITAGLQRADRVNAPIPASEQLSMANYACQELYGLLVSKRQKLFETAVTFTLVGGVGANFIDLYANYPDFQALTLVEKQTTTIGTSPYYATVSKINTSAERNLINAPPISPLWGLTFVRWDRLGKILSFYPANNAAGTYQITYIPKLPTFTTSSQIDGYFMNINGWDEHIVYGIAAKVLIKEKDIETANAVLQQQAMVAQRLMLEVQPDDNEPGYIKDVKSLRGTGGGFPGAGPNGWTGWGF